MELNGLTANYDLTGWRKGQIREKESSESFVMQMDNEENGQKNGHKVYLKTDDMLFSGGYGSGLSFYIKYAENSTDEDPIVVAKGVDENGREFEQTIHINDINPNSATLVQMHALEAHLGVDKGQDLSSLPKGLGNMGLYDRVNFMDLFRQSIRDMNMLGERRGADFYRNSMKAYADFMTNKGKSGASGKAAGSRVEKEDVQQADEKTSTSESQIITKPDGSRVLLVTTHVGGRETVMSIVLSQRSPLMGDQEAAGGKNGKDTADEKAGTDVSLEK